MTDTLAGLAAAHSPGFVLAAVLVCCTTAWLVLVLSDRAAETTGAARIGWSACVAVVLGFGIWTTHFLAVLGWRPDVLFGFDPDATLTSAASAVLLVGVPVAACASIRRPIGRAVLGAVGGAGIAAMHFVGTSALEGCATVQDPGSRIAAWVAGAALLGASAAIGRGGVRSAASGTLLVLAVATVHFAGMAGLSVEAGAADHAFGVERGTLGILAAAIAFALFLVATVLASSAARIEEQKRHSSILSVALDNMTNGLLVVDGSGRILLFNGRLVEILELPPGRLAVGMKWTRYLEAVSDVAGWTSGQRRRVSDEWEARIAAGDGSAVERTLRDGRTVSTTCRTVPGMGSVFTCIDVTQEREKERRILHMAHHDALTGLANRRAFRDGMEESLGGGGRWRLLLIDLDRFKAVNDTHGHAVGDALLVEVAERLRALCGTNDLPARIGGDELAVFGPRDADGSDEELARAVVEEMGRPFAIAGHEVSVGCSIGIATSEDALDPDALTHCADLALFEAKITGRNRACRYRSETTGMDYLRTLADNDLDLEGGRDAA